MCKVQRRGTGQGLALCLWHSFKQTGSPASTRDVPQSSSRDVEHEAGHGDSRGVQDLWHIQRVAVVVVLASAVGGRQVCEPNHAAHGSTT